MGSADISSSSSSTIDVELIKESNNNTKKYSKSSSTSAAVVVPIENESSTITIQTIQNDIGIGPCRFASAKGTSTERTLTEQINSLSMEEKMCYHNLKIKWEENILYEPFISDDWYLRFARNSPGSKQYNEKSAWNVMINFNRKYDKLTAEVLEEQLLTKTIFPIPELVSKDGLHEFVYIQPSRSSSNNKDNNKQDATNSLKLVLYNLVYVINTMCSTSEKNCTEGIGVMFNMKNYQRNDTNFSTEYISQCIKILKGAIPVRLYICLFIDAPMWFKQYWPLLSVGYGSDFRSKTYFISSSSSSSSSSSKNQLSHYLQDGYEEFLPNEFNNNIGKADTDLIVTDFITYRKYIEEKCLLPKYFDSSKKNNNLLESSKENDVYLEMFTSLSINDNNNNNMKNEQQQQQEDDQCTVGSNTEATSTCLDTEFDNENSTSESNNNNNNNNNKFMDVQKNIKNEQRQLEDEDQCADGSTVATTMNITCFDTTFDIENSISNVSSTSIDNNNDNNNDEIYDDDEDYSCTNNSNSIFNDESIEEQQNEQKSNNEENDDTDYGSMIDLDEAMDYYEPQGTKVVV